MASGITFEILATDGRARTGVLGTARGSMPTPAFMPVGTAATVKAMLPEHVAESGAKTILCNTYHLMLRPGEDRIAKLGGLHRFMNWEGSILTDSGGFQVMSLKSLRKLDEDGVRFKSHIDGSDRHLSPERSMLVQEALGSDIAMCFDECAPHPISREEAARSMRLSMRWAARSKAAFGSPPGRALFGIQQGSVFEDLRRESSDSLLETGFDGYAIGGLAVGEGQELMFGVLDYAPAMLPADKPRYLMGVGKPGDIVGAVARGVDMFDCVLPTRSGRTGQAFTRTGVLNLRNAACRDDPSPIDSACCCPVCAKYSRAYLHHVVKAKEIIAAMLITRHNLCHYQQLMSEIRSAVGRGEFAEFFREFSERQTASEPRQAGLSVG